MSKVNASRYLESDAKVGGVVAMVGVRVGAFDAWGSRAGCYTLILELGKHQIHVSMLFMEL